MLWEFWQYLTTRCPPWVGDMGYLTESISINSRYHRCKEAWTPHLKQTRQFVIQGIQSCKNHRTACVLGSGWLLDIPLETLSESFDEVILVDMIQPNAVKRKMRKYGNVECVGGDISGMGKLVYDLGKELEHHDSTRDTLPPLPDLKDAKLPELGDIDFMVSANILSQLPYVPLLWLESFKDRHFLSLYKRDVLQTFARKLIESHFEYIQKISETACLITDHTCIVKDPEDNELETKDLLYGFDKPDFDQSWEWQLAPLKEIDAKKSFTSFVGASLLKQT